MFPDITIKGLMGCCGGTTRVILDNVRVAAINVVGKDKRGRLGVLSDDDIGEIGYGSYDY